MNILGPGLAQGFIYTLCAHKIKELYDLSCKNVEEGSFKLFEVLHHFTAGFKSILTDAAYQGNDKMRQLCGGAGYLLASGVSTNW